MGNRTTMKEAESLADARHVLGISGGKDSAALAIYIKDHYPKLHERMEYFFTDTGAELKEIYEFLDKLEAYLGKEIVKLSSGKPFEHWLKMHSDYLPSPRQRWCTRVMKLKPFEAFVGDDPVFSYVGIRADEDREGYISHKETIRAVFPFIEDDLVRSDIFRILKESVGVPAYYEWRDRSGCFFCFFQQQREWLGLKRNHPDLFEEARRLEKEAGNGYTWVQGKSLDEVIERAEERERQGVLHRCSEGVTWQEKLESREDDEPEDQACLICSL